MTNQRPQGKRYPRLAQPLFHSKYSKDYALAWKEPMLASFIRAYDAIYNLLYYPTNMTTEDIFANAEVNLEALGGAIEKVLGEKVFQPLANPDDTQLSFDFESEEKQTDNSP